MRAADRKKVDENWAVYIKGLKEKLEKVRTEEADIFEMLREVDVLNQPYDDKTKEPEHFEKFERSWIAYGKGLKEKHEKVKSEEAELCEMLREVDVLNQQYDKARRSRTSRKV
jgi:hypothetical protein